MDTSDILEENQPLEVGSGAHLLAKSKTCNFEES